jgi:hypothetical protein
MRARQPTGVAVDSAGNLYIADLSNHRIRKVTVATGIITTVAGHATVSGGDGDPATSASLSAPYGVAVDAAGNIFIADQGHHRIRKVTVATGIISSVAGSGGAPAFGGDGGLATEASLYFPTGVALDTAGNIYLVDHDNDRIRKVSIPPPPVGLTVIKRGTGGGTVTSSPAGIDCGATCSGNFASGSLVTLTATPDPGASFPAGRPAPGAPIAARAPASHAHRRLVDRRRFRADFGGLQRLPRRRAGSAVHGGDG